MTFNQTTTPLDLLRTRRSGKARDMVEPGPDPATLEAILTLATRVPDHGKLTPWQLVVVPPDQRAALADKIEALYRAEKGDVGRLEVEAIRAYALQAPTLIIVLSTPKPESHIPLWEQELSAGALCQNLLLAAHAHGFVANWLTGWPAYCAALAQTLCPQAGARIAGLIYIGTPLKALDERPRPALAQVVRYWPA